MGKTQLLVTHLRILLITLKRNKDPMQYRIDDSFYLQTIEELKLLEEERNSVCAQLALLEERINKTCSMVLQKLKEDCEWLDTFNPSQKSVL